MGKSKKGKNTDKCKAYRTAGTQEKNKARSIARNAREEAKRVAKLEKRKALGEEQV